MENKVGIILICTGKYSQFLQPLVNSMGEYFFINDGFDVYLLSDRDYPVNYCDRADVKRFDIPHLPFPFPTLYRYKWILQYAEEITANNVFYMDVDMLFTGFVDKEILSDGLVATRHPGFYARGGWGDKETSKYSTAYLAPKLRNNYYAGGFQGGNRNAFITACHIMSVNIDIDLTLAREIGYTKNGGVLARWHDETHWNYYLKHVPFKELTPEYCMVEEKDLRVKWGIDNLTPRIIAVKKDHKQLRT